jgi:predicted metal-dependent hydrolase
VKKVIALSAHEVEYTLRTSERARSLRLTIYPDGRVVVTAPVSVSEEVVERFMRQKSAWVVGKLDYFKRSPRVVLEAGRNGFVRYHDSALALVTDRLAYFNKLYDFRFNRVTVKKQKARWGSCSKKGNLNFNYRLVLLPSHLADYIIVHELCHLAEFNHSAAFWAQVARAIPNWRTLRKELAKTVVR